MLTGWQMIVASATLQLAVILDAVRCCLGKPEELPQFFVPFPQLMLWGGTLLLAEIMQLIGAARIL